MASKRATQTQEVLLTTKSTPEPKKHSPYSLTALQLLLIDLYLRQLPVLEKIQSWRSPLLDAYMRAATLLGDEIFFITFLPFCSWTVDPQLALQLTLLMSTCIYVGNVIKNIFSIPRPPHPRIQCLGSQETDHGFPSTHTMSGVAIPSYFFIWLLSNNPEYFGNISVFWVIVATVFISASVTFSRNYNGHHSISDITGGFVFSLIILSVWIYFVDDRLKDWVFTGPLYVPAVCFVVGILLLKVHPFPVKPTSALGESGLVVGTGVGTISSNWAIRYFGIFTEPLVLKEYYLFGMIPSSRFVFYLVRFILGAALVFLTRMLCKLYLTQFFKSNFPTMFDPITTYEQPTLEATREYINRGGRHKETPRAGVDLPVKYLSYIAISSMIVLGAPLVFSMIGLGAPVDCSYHLSAKGL